jgi:hypothetical protein
MLKDAEESREDVDATGRGEAAQTREAEHADWLDRL